ncbi:MAG: hypothetical protein ACKPEA_02170 [Planctomycetota bacterium]
MSRNLAQLFARLIVCVVFLPAGAHALFGVERFTPDEAQRIRDMDTPAAAFEKVVERAKPASLREAAAASEDDATTLRAVNRVALRLQDARVPKPALVAWVVAAVMLLGGVAAIAGFLTKLFMPPLALIGAFMLWRAAWPALGGSMPWFWSAAQSQMAAAWLAAALLPVQLFLDGPGSPSIDRMLKGGKGKGGAKPAPAA